MKTWMIVGTGIAALTAAGGVAIAQPAPPRPAQGTVSVSDLKQRAAERFDRLDANHDNQISRQELQARRGAMRDGSGPRGRMGARRGGPDGAVRGGPRGGAMFGKADTNRDGAVTQSEFTAQAVQRFQRLDANHDGRIVNEEMRVPGSRSGGPRGRLGARGGAPAPGRLAMLDADRNGSISRAEFERAQADRLIRLDADHDGKVTREERQANRPNRSGPAGQRQF
jgi:Ca2+-binding EF-hand superfamily protein